MILVPQKLTLTSIEELIEKVRANPEAVLSFPCQIELRSILSSAAYIQFLLTWASVSQQREVRFTVSNPEHLPFLSRAAETFIPLLLAKKVTVRETQSLTELDFDVNASRQDGLNYFSPTSGISIQQNLFGKDEPNFSVIPRKGPRVNLLMSDADFRHGSSHWFYTGSPDARQMRDADDLASLIRDVLDSMRGHWGNNKMGRWSDGLPEILGDMLYELIDNTHKWGKQSIEGETLKSLRGAQFDVRFDFPGNRTRIVDIATDIPLIADFIRFHSSREETRHLGLLEMSVFDGGIGLPTRELAKTNQTSATIQQEYEATQSCLKKWGTTSGQKGRGLGLDRVLELTSQRQGFIYLRTGRLILYRDFANTPLSKDASLHESSTFEKHVLYDATTHSTIPTEETLVRGTLLTVVLPFNAALS